jgi:hypothetical protein
MKVFIFYHFYEKWVVVAETLVDAIQKMEEQGGFDRYPFTDFLEVQEHSINEIKKL